MIGVAGWRRSPRSVATDNKSSSLSPLPVAATTPLRCLALLHVSRHGTSASLAYGTCLPAAALPFQLSRRRQRPFHYKIAQQNVGVTGDGRCVVASI